MPRAGQTIKPLVRLGRTADACWTFLGPLTKDGHPKKTYCGVEMRAQRWMWEQLFGPIPPGHVIFNSCHAKDCCNPHHLRCGMQADANRHSVQTLLMSNDVFDIQRAKDGAGPQTARELASRFGCSTQTVRDIWRGRSWKRRKAPNYGPRHNIA